MTGYKGFNKNLQCIGFQFEVGKTYAIERKDLKLCSKGFHFVEKFEDIDSYYSIGDGNRFCEILALGEVITDSSKKKYVTDIIQIVREIPMSEIAPNKNKEIWIIAKEIVNKHPQVQLGGSLGLMLAGYLPMDSRVVTDIDIIVPYYIPIAPDLPKKSVDELFLSAEVYPDNPNTNKVSKSFSVKGIKVDMFINPKSIPTTYKQTFEGNDYLWNVAPLIETIQAKVLYALSNPNSPSAIKHRQDLQQIFANKK